MADYKNIVLGVTAEELEERVKKPIDEWAIEDSENLVTSGAVFSAVKNAKIKTENLVDDSVTTEKLAYKAVKTDNINNYAVTNSKIASGAVNSLSLAEGAVTNSRILDNTIKNEKVADKTITSDKIADKAITTENLDTASVTSGKLADSAVNTGHIVDGAVTEEKIADNSVDYNHLKDKAVTPEKLDREYVRLHQSSAGIAIRFESQFHNYLVTGAKNEIDELEPFRKICMFSVALTDGLLSVIGTGRFYGFYISKSAFTFTRLGVNPQTFLALWNAEKITSIELVGDNAVADQSYIPTSENAQSGIAVNEAFEIFKEQYRQIKNVTLQEISYMALLEQLKTFGAIRFNTGGQDFTGSSTDLNLPRGEYLAFYNGASSYCLELTSAIAYRFSGHDLFDTGEYTFAVSSPLWEAKTDIFNLIHSLGDIDTALDNIIAIQNSYIGGADK